jgi:hypothetical protein
MDTAIHIYGSISVAGIIAIIGILLNQHKVWVRMKDYVNTLWYERCENRIPKERFVAVDGNGK